MAAHAEENDLDEEAATPIKEPTNEETQESDHEPQPSQTQPSQADAQAQVKTYARVTNANSVEGAGFFDDYLYRQTAWSGLIFLFCVLSIGRMFHKAIAPDCGYEEGHEHYRSISAGFVMCGIGLIVILSASLVVTILSVLKRRMFGILLFIVLLIGSIVYIIGSWIITAEVPYIYCSVGASASILGGYGCIYFGEFFLIGSLSIVLGLDLWKDRFLNSFRFRMILILSIVAFGSLVTFFGYVILSNYLFKEHLFQNKALAQDFALVSAGWFFTFLSVVIYLVILLQVKTSGAYLCCSIVLITATLLCAIGYFGMFQVGEEFDNGYYCGMAFFVLGVGIILAVDMSLGKYIKKHVLRR